MALTFKNGRRHWKTGFYPWQGTYYAIAHKIGEEFDAGNRFGAFNAGIYGYYCPHTVINIDGLVNNAAFDAMKNKTLFDDFLRRQRIDYIVDHAYIVKMYWRLFGTGDMAQTITPVIVSSIPWRFAQTGSADIIIYRFENVPPQAPATQNEPPSVTRPDH
jgi:hypothetical protein